MLIPLLIEKKTNKLTGYLAYMILTYFALEYACFPSLPLTVTLPLIIIIYYLIVVKMMIK